jgi:hypothetical protein
MNTFSKLLTISMVSIVAFSCNSPAPEAPATVTVTAQAEQPMKGVVEEVLTKREVWQKSQSGLT